MLGIGDRMRTRAGFTLVEIMIVVGIIGLLAVIAIPSFQKARATSQRNACMNNMRVIEAAKERWAFAYMKNDGDAVRWSDIDPYLKKRPECPAGGEYDEMEIGAPIYCTEHDWRGNPDYAGFTP